MVALWIKGDHCTRYCCNTNRKKYMKASPLTRYPATRELKWLVKWYIWTLGGVCPAYLLYYFFRLWLQPKALVCYHETLRPVGLRKQATPIKGVGYFPSLHPRNPSQISFWLLLLFSWYICLQNLGAVPLTSFEVKVRGTQPRLQNFFRWYYEYKNFWRKCTRTRRN